MARKGPGGAAELTVLRRELRSMGDAERAANLRWFFQAEPGGYGEGDRFHGIRMPVLRILARKHGTLPLNAIRALLRSRYHEERMLALLLMVQRYERGDEAAREAVFRLYLDSLAHINNWDLVDASAPRIVGAHLRTRDRGLLRELARSPIVWERRIAVLATFAFIRAGEHADALALARLLLRDREDLIHKAVGWMLREIGNRDRSVEETFLRQHAAQMPRTMLRYAIEKFPERERQRWLRMGRESG